MDLFAQERKISGIVKGENDQELIIGANVIIKGTRRGTVTNTHGKFTISVGQSDKELEISYVGMQKKTIKLEANKSSYVIELEEEYNSLEDVIVIGYGTQAKRDVIGSIFHPKTWILIPEEISILLCREKFRVCKSYQRPVNQEPDH